eukprot:8638089-Heterocapsa_arctica.AAC.1
MLSGGPAAGARGRAAGAQDRAGGLSQAAASTVAHDGHGGVGLHGSGVRPRRRRHRGRAAR